MKRNLYLLLLAVLASALSLRAQTTTTNVAGASAIATHAATKVVDTTNTLMSTTNTVANNTTNAVKPVARAAAKKTSATVARAGTSDIPLIQFSDVPLTTAIENLARQAGINYMLDPNIGYGQPDQNGHIQPEPTLSIRWENITAENALLALLDNYGLQLVKNKDTGIARISKKDPTAPPPLITRVVQLKYASVSNIIDSVQSTLTDKRSKVLGDVRTSQIIVVATDPEQQAVDTLVDQLDKPTRQVLIETKLVEISSNPETQKGIDWSGTLQAQHFGFGNNVNQAGRYTTDYKTTSLTTQNNLVTNTESILQTVYGAPQLLQNPSLLVDTAKGLNPTTAFLDADGLSAVLSFLNSESDAQVVSTPRIVTADNDTAKISVTQTYPVINVTASTANTSGGSQVTYSNVGTVLEVTPRITADDRIWLKVMPDVSSFAGTTKRVVANQEYDADTFVTRHFETEVLVPNANTLVLGGLVQDNPTSKYTKVPLLGDIPGLGYIFRSEDKQLNKNNLLVFITPTIIKDDDFTPTPTDFLKSKPKELKSSMNPNTSWDGARPAGNWSNPAPVKGEFQDSEYNYNY